MAISKSYLKKLKQEAIEQGYSKPKDYTVNEQYYDDNFFKSFFPHLQTVEECMEFARANDIHNDMDILAYISKDLWK